LGDCPYYNHRDITVNMKFSMMVSICKFSERTLAHPNIFLATRVKMELFTNNSLYGKYVYQLDM
jgi:hypothetical protein